MLLLYSQTFQERASRLTPLLDRGEQRWLRYVFLSFLRRYTLIDPVRDQTCMPHPILAACAATVP
jgi:hypothetical protein